MVSKEFSLLKFRNQPLRDCLDRTPYLVHLNIRIYLRTLKTNALPRLNPLFQKT